MTSMKAVQITQIGGPDVMQLVELPVPTPKPHQVRIKVEAVGLNYSDVMIRQGKYLAPTKPPVVLGREFAGTIEAVGESVTGWAVGQQVFGAAGAGALAEYVTIAPQALAPIPPGMSMEQAAAFFVTGVTALHCLSDHGRLKEGETVLIHAAAGGVGTAAVQIAKSMGARVIGTASSAAKCDQIRALGGEAIQYGPDADADWVEQLKAMTDGHGADLILESVGGEVFLRSFREALAPFGRLVVFGAASGEVVKLNNVEILGSNREVIGYFLGTYYQYRPQAIMAAAAQVLGMIQAGTLKLVIGATYPLDQARAAFEHIESRQSVGKVIVKP